MYSLAQPDAANSKNLFASNAFDPDFSHNHFRDKYWESGSYKSSGQGDCVHWEESEEHILGIKIVKLKDAFWVKILSLNLFLTTIRKPLGQILHLTKFAELLMDAYKLLNGCKNWICLINSIVKVATTICHAFCMAFQPSVCGNIHIQPQNWTFLLTPNLELGA